MTQLTCAKNFVKFGLVAFETYARGQTDRQTDMLIAILRNPTGGKVKNDHQWRPDDDDDKDDDDTTFKAHKDGNHKEESLQLQQQSLGGSTSHGAPPEGIGNCEVLVSRTLSQN